MKKIKIDFQTILLGITLLFLIFTKSCDNSQDVLIDYMNNQTKQLTIKFDSLNNTIGKLELEVTIKDTTIKYYRNFYYETAKEIDNIEDNNILRDSIRSKLQQLGRARFNEN